MDQVAPKKFTSRMVRVEMGLEARTEHVHWRRGGQRRDLEPIVK